MANTKKPIKPVIAQVKIGGRVVYENPTEMYKIRYNDAIKQSEEKLEATNYKEALDLIQKIKEKK